MGGLLGVLARPACHFLGYVYPAYQSFKAIKADDENLHAQWLTYWVANAAITLIGDNFISWIPFYYEIKVALIVWLVTPRLQGAGWLYDNVIGPLLLTYEKEIDEGVDHLQRRSTAHLDRARKEGIRQLRAQSEEFIGFVQKGVVRQLLRDPTRREDGDSAASVNAEGLGEGRRGGAPQPETHQRRRNPRRRVARGNDDEIPEVD